MLSRDTSISCGFCHQQFAGFGHSDHPLSHGIGVNLEPVMCRVYKI
ncbi:hypothetical protein [Spirosoma telluris]